jgi:hypothetical protein
MPLRCCNEPDFTPVLHLAERGVPHDRESHEFIHDYTVVLQCAACGGGLVETQSHDCWAAMYEGEPANLTWWWRVDPADMPHVRGVLAACPAPQDPGCACSVHGGLGGPNRNEWGGAGPRTPGHNVVSHLADVDIPRVTVRIVEGTPRWA